MLLLQKFNHMLYIALFGLLVCYYMSACYNNEYIFHRQCGYYLELANKSEDVKEIKAYIEKAIAFVKMRYLPIINKRYNPESTFSLHLDNEFIIWFNKLIDANRLLANHLTSISEKKNKKDIKQSEEFVIQYIKTNINIYEVPNGVAISHLVHLIYAPVIFCIMGTFVIYSLFQLIHLGGIAKKE